MYINLGFVVVFVVVVVFMFGCVCPQFVTFYFSLFIYSFAPVGSFISTYNLKCCNI